MTKKVVVPVFLCLLVLVLGGCSLVQIVNLNLSDLWVDGERVQGFDPEQKVYFVSLPEGTTDIPKVTAEPMSSKVFMEIEDASSLPGTTVVRITGNIGGTKTYLVNFTVEDANNIPVQDMIIHRDLIKLPVNENAHAISRAIVCKLIAESFDYQSIDVANPFSDLTPESDYYEEILACYAAGVIRGYDDGTFRPDLLIDRASWATLLTRCLEYSLPVNEPSIPDLDPADWAYEPVITVVDAGLMSLYKDGTFKPYDNLETNIYGYIIPIIIPGDASVKKVCFSSSDENIVLVDQNGQMTGVSPGNAEILISTLDGSIHKFVSVSVSF